MNYFYYYKRMEKELRWIKLFPSASPEFKLEYREQFSDVGYELRYDSTLLQYTLTNGNTLSFEQGEFLHLSVRMKGVTLEEMNRILKEKEIIAEDAEATPMLYVKVQNLRKPVAFVSDNNDLIAEVDLKGNEVGKIIALSASVVLSKEGVRATPGIANHVGDLLGDIDIQDEIVLCWSFPLYKCRAPECPWRLWHYRLLGHNGDDGHLKRWMCPLEDAVSIYLNTESYLYTKVADLSNSAHEGKNKANMRTKELRRIIEHQVMQEVFFALLQEFLNDCRYDRETDLGTFLAACNGSSLARVLVNYWGGPDEVTKAYDMFCSSEGLPYSEWHETFKHQAHNVKFSE